MFSFPVTYGKIYSEDVLENSPNGLSLYDVVGDRIGDTEISPSSSAWRSVSSGSDSDCGGASDAE